METPNVIYLNTCKTGDGETAIIGWSTERISKRDRKYILADARLDKFVEEIERRQLKRIRKELAMMCNQKQILEHIDALIEKGGLSDDSMALV